MRRLKLELKQTMEMYSNAYKEALTAQQKVRYYGICFCILKAQNGLTLNAMQCITGCGTPMLEIRGREEIGGGKACRRSCIGGCKKGEGKIKSSHRDS